MAVGKRAADRLLRRLRERIAHAGADEAQREGRSTSQHLGERNGGGQRVTGRREAVDEANAMRLVCLDQLASVEQLINLRCAKKTWNPKNAPASGENSQVHLGEAETA